jgi:hypothetical protein
MKSPRLWLHGFTIRVSSMHMVIDRVHGITKMQPLNPMQKEKRHH